MPNYEDAPIPGQPETPAEKLDNIVRVNPSLKNDPSAAVALGNVQGVDGNTAGQASKGTSWLGHLTNAFADIGKDAKGAWNETGAGLQAGSVDLGKGIYDTATKAANNITEGLSLGHFGPYGTDVAKNEQDFNEGFGGALEDVQHPITATQKIWNMMAHYGAFMDTMAHQHGVAYAAAYSVPQALGAVVGDGLFTGAGITGDAADAGDLSTVASLTSKSENGQVLSVEEQSRLAGAQARIERVQQVRDSAGASESAQADLISKTRDAFKGAAAVAERTHAGQGLGLMLRGLSRVAKMSGNFRLNATMYLTEMAANSNPEMRALWEKTANLHVYDKYGRNVGTLGQSLADTLGLRHDAIARSLVSGTIDAYTHYLGSDPIMAYGELANASRSAGGMGGILGKWWSGLGIESGNDVYRTWDSSIQSRRAYNYMATHNAAQIARTFPGMYPPEVLTKLGDARNVNEVLDIHAELADAVGVTRRVAPTMGIVKGARLVLRGGRTVYDIMGGDIRGVIDNAEEIERATGWIVRPTTTTEAVSDAQTRMETSFARRAAQRIRSLLQTVPMLLEKDDSGNWKFETHTYAAGDRNAIPIIGNQLRRVNRFTELQVQLTEDILQHTASPSDMVKAVVNTNATLMRDAIAAAAPDANRQMVRDALSRFVDEQSYRTQAYNEGGGEQTSKYLNGRNVQGAEGLAHPQGSDYGQGSFGLGFTHRGRWAFIDFRAARNFIDTATEQLTKEQPLFEGHFSKLQELADKDMQQAIEYKDAKLKDIPARVKSLVETGQRELDAVSTTTGSAYKLTHDQLFNMISDIKNDSTLSETQKYFKASKNIVWKARELEQRIAAQAETWSPDLAEAGNKRTSVAFDQGALQAVRDYEQELFRNFMEPGVTVNRIRRWAVKNAETATQVESERRAMVDDLFGKVLKSKLYENHGFLNRSNVIVDGLNRALSRTFIPMALSTGGFIFRITNSELLLNVIRIGTREFAASRLTASIAKNVLKGTDLAEAPGIDEFVHETEDAFRRVIPNAPVESAPLEEGIVPNEEDQFARRAANIRAGMTEEGLIKNTVTNTVKNLYQTVEGVPEDITQGMSKSAIARAQQAAHDMFLGTLTGIERGVLSGMSDEELWRLMDNTTNYTMRNGGHIPDMGHGKSTSQFDPDVHSRAIEDSMGIHKNSQGEWEVSEANTQRGENYARADEKHLATAHVENLNRIFQDPILHPSMVDLQGEIARAGERGFPTPRDYDELIDRLTVKQFDRLVAMNPHELEGMQRAVWPIKNGAISTGKGPMMDWAKAISMNTVGSVAGYTGVSSTEKMILQKVLVDQAVSGRIDTPVEMAYRLAAMGESAPKDIIAREFEDYGLFKGPMKRLFSKNFFQEVNRLGIDRVMGPIMGWVSRQPVSAWEYHLAYESLRPQIEAGALSEAEAETMADQEALRRLARFVHNPADRYAFEANTRIYAPFWFAQNQALRRATRVAAEDFGAFDRYLRASLAVTHYVATHTVKGVGAALSFPASTWLVNFGVNTAVNTLGLFTHVNPTERSILGALGIGLNMDAASVQTIAPTGPQRGWGMFGNMFRPSSGPFVDIPLKGLHYFIDASWYNRVLLDALGPIGSSSGITTDIIPSAADRAAAAVGQDISSIAENRGTAQPNPAVAAVQVAAMHSALDNLMSKYISEYESSKFANTHSYLGDPAIGLTATAQFMTDARIYADRKVEKFLKSGSRAVQGFVDDTQVVALAMYTVKAAAGFAGPASVTLNQHFSKASEYQKILNTKLPGGTKPSANEAIIEFATKYPSNFLDLVSSSQTPRGSLPEDQTFQDWATKAKAAIQEFPHMLSYVINRNTAYVPSLYSIQHTMGLRNPDTPQEYIDAVNIALGNDVFYNSIEPNVYFESGSAYYGPNNPKNQLNSAGIKDLASAAKHFGNTYNPTWYASSDYGTGDSKKIDAVQDLNKFASNNNTALVNSLVRKGLMSRATVNNLKYLDSAYHYYIKQVNNAISTGGSGAAQKAELYDAFSAFATSPRFINEQYLITSVLQLAPTAQ